MQRARSSARARRAIAQLMTNNYISLFTRVRAQVSMAVPPGSRGANYIVLVMKHDADRTRNGQRMRIYAAMLAARSGPRSRIACVSYETLPAPVCADECVCVLKFIRHVCALAFPVLVLADSCVCACV